MPRPVLPVLLPTTLLLACAPAVARATETTSRLDLTATWVGALALLIFVGAYALVMMEEFLHLRKSKPVVLAAGLIWLLIAWYYTTHHGDPHAAEQAVRHNIMEFAELFLPVMFAVLTMNPEMSQGMWLLVTLTAGVGGSMLSIGSAAGVALMGQSKGMYTLFGHLKWTPHIAAGFVASAIAHGLLNWRLFSVPVGG